MKLSAMKRAMVAVAISVPAGFFAPAILSLGGSAAHATSGTACIDIVGVPSTGPCPVAPGSGGATDQAAVNVCTPANSSNGQAPTVVYNSSDIGVDSPPVQAWTNGDASNLAGQFEVAGVGIASQQTGC